MSSNRYAVFNPENKPLADLPVIYGFNNGGSWGWMHACLIAEDGTGLGSHICTNEDFMLGDLGILTGTRSDRHETFREHYPNGYRMDFVSFTSVDSHTALQRAFALNDEQRAERETQESRLPDTTNHATAREGER
jgi:hypothetical protein